MQLREAAGYTQQELADEVGVSRRMIAYYEGQSTHPPTTLLPSHRQGPRRDDRRAPRRDPDH